MIDHAIIDTLNLNSRDFASRWQTKIRKNPQLKHYNQMADEALIDSHVELYPLLGRTLDRGLDRSLVGGYFVKLGKERLAGEYPVSEVIFGCNLSERVVIEYIMTEYAPESPVRMYQSIDVISRVAEFFMLGGFYVTKGFLEATYTSLKGRHNLPDDLLKQYFRDDFFFKKDV